MSEKEKNKNPITDIFCSTCGAPAEFDIAGQTYFCRFCGAKTGIAESLEKKNEFRDLHRENMKTAKPDFKLFSSNCTGCGAEIVFEENEALTDCAFCGRKLVRKEYLKTEDFPDLVIPFKITRDQAIARLSEWCGANSKRKEATRLSRVLDKVEGYYLPYMLVKGPGVSTVKREGTMRNYYCRGYIDGMFVNTSNNLNNMLLNGIEPFDLADLHEFEFSYLAGHRVKIADLKDSDAEQRVMEEIAAEYEPTVARVMETRAVKVEPDVGGMSMMTAVLPVYYVHKGGVTAAVNGQTGKVAVWELKDRFLLPWWLKPIAAVIALTALVFGATRLFGAEWMGTALITGMMAIFLLITVFAAYHNEYGGSERFKLRRRVLASDDVRPEYAKPVFYERLDDVDRPVKLRFTTPFRILRMGVLALVVVFLPLVIGFILNGFSAEGLTLAGAAVWLCIAVPVAPIYFLGAARLHLYYSPLIYAVDDKGNAKRYHSKANIKERLHRIKGSVFNPAVLIAGAIALVILIINVVLVLHWDEY